MPGARNNNSYTGQILSRVLNGNGSNGTNARTTKPNNRVGADRNLSR